jgi:hypothetical protein
VRSRALFLLMMVQPPITQMITNLIRVHPNDPRLNLVSSGVTSAIRILTLGTGTMEGRLSLCSVLMPISIRCANSATVGKLKSSRNGISI